MYTKILHIYTFVVYGVLIEFQYLNFKMMKKNLVVKDNSLISASYNLDLVEQRLLLLSIVKIRDLKYREESKQIIFQSESDELMLTVQDYVEIFKVHPNTAYDSLKNACKTLFEKKFVYQRISKKGVLEHVTSRWVQRIVYAENEAYVKVKFSADVEPLILNLEKNFTTYELQQIAELGSGYAVRIYELIIAWRTSGQTPIFELNEFRRQLGILETQYSRMGQFKEKVLHIALKQITESTDIVVEYEQHKRGRTITGFSFSFKHKNPHQVPLLKDKNTITALTEKQINLFARKLAYDDSFSSKYAEPGEDYDDVEKRLIQKLADPEFVLKHMNTLEAHGFKWKS